MYQQLGAPNQALIGFKVDVLLYLMLFKLGTSHILHCELRLLVLGMNLGFGVLYGHRNPVGHV
jgi:hypothetical protein